MDNLRPLSVSVSFIVCLITLGQITEVEHAQLLQLIVLVFLSHTFTVEDFKKNLDEFFD